MFSFDLNNGFEKDSRIKTLEQELELFEWEFQRLRDRSFSLSSNNINKSNNNISNERLNRDKCKSVTNMKDSYSISDLIQANHLSTVPKCIKTDAEKEVRLLT